MNEEEKDKSQMPDKVNEPQAEYRSGKKYEAPISSDKQEITICSSLEEMNEHQYRHGLSLSPIQRLTEHYKIITGIYNYKDNGSPVYDKIYFD